MAGHRPTGGESLGMYLDREARVVTMGGGKRGVVGMIWAMGVTGDASEERVLE